MGMGRWGGNRAFFTSLLGCWDLPLSLGAGAPAVAGGTRVDLREKRGLTLAWAEGVGLGAAGEPRGGERDGGDGEERGGPGGGRCKLRQLGEA